MPSIPMIAEMERMRRISSETIAMTPVTAEGASRCRMRELITAREGAPTFAMRQFAVEPGGHTPFHSHPWEHEVFVLKGRGRVRLETGAEPIQAGDAILVTPGETHSFEAADDSELVFLCMIPVEQTCCR